MPCLFCELSKNKSVFLHENESFYVIPDKFPACKGHSLIILKKHKESFFDLQNEELKDLKDALYKTKILLDEKFHPDAYNLGINEGAAAGRTIHHFHAHLIPRYVSEPAKGGIEALLKGK